MIINYAHVVPLPPESVLTHWGIWVKATSYYYQYFKQM